MSLPKTISMAFTMGSLCALQQAHALPDCTAWIENKVPVGPGMFLTPTPGRLVTADMNQVTAAGVTLEPSRRMQPKDYPKDYPGDQEIQIALPPSYGKTDRRYPVLWVTDGSMLFQAATALVTSCANKNIPEMIVVGIGAPPEAIKETQRRRTFDFSPVKTNGYSGFESKPDKKPADKDSDDRFGGASRFLNFISKDVREQLAHDYRMADDHTLFGHSGGGLFCGYVLVTQPDAFDRFICGSAALSGMDYEVFRSEERYAQQHKDLAAVVFLGAGEKEVLDKKPSDIFSSTARLAEVLKSRGYPSLKLYFRAFEGESHTSVIPPLLAQGLRSVWEGDFKAD